MLIGAFEANASVQDAASRGAIRLQPGGTAASAIGIAASTAIYLGLGWASEASALRTGASVGAAAGAIGSAVRAWIIADWVAEIVSRYAAVPDWFVPLVLAVFVALATLVSAGAGAAIAFVGARFKKARATSDSARED